MDPSVNYPIVQTKNNSYYLKHGFGKSYNITDVFSCMQITNPIGVIQIQLYMDIIMINGSMFGNNKLYKSKSYTEAHPYFYVYTPSGKMTYTIFDVMTVNDATVPYTIDMQTKEDFQSYLDTIKKLSTYQMNVPVTTDDHIVTLSTCTNHGRQRFLIQGVLTNIENNNE